nr:phosphoribosyltransferase family protein [Paenarthrobacter nitroguajacolicus]
MRRMLPFCPVIDVLERRGDPSGIKAAPQAVREAAARLFGEVSGRIPVERGSGGQKGLGRGERARRVRGSMRVRRGRGKELRGRRCILVDDVLTTGATLAEAARAVTLAGGVVSGAVVLAATRPPAYASVAAEDHLMQALRLNQKLSG